MPVRLMRDRPRVLMTTDAVGGVWTYAIGAAEGLIAEGVEVDLVVLGPPPSAGQRAAALATQGLKLHEIEGVLDWMASDARALQPVADELGRLADGRGVDLVHLNSPSLAGLVAFQRPVIGVCHSCVATWWAAVRPAEPLPADLAWRRDLVARGYAACNALVAPTQAFADATQAVYGLEPKVVRNGISASPRRRYSREPFALAAGRLWDEGKGGAMLEAIAGRLSAPLFALGALEGPGGERVHFEHVRAKGRVAAAEVAGWMRRASVFVSSAVYEPFGLAVLEAAQAGCALVLSDIPAFRELWDGAAVFAPPDDADAFVAAVEMRLQDRSALRKAADAASARAKRFSLSTMIAGVLDVYRGLAPDVIGAPTSLKVAV